MKASDIFAFFVIFWASSFAFSTIPILEPQYQIMFPIVVKTTNSGPIDSDSIHNLRKRQVGNGLQLPGQNYQNLLRQEEIIILKEEEKLLAREEELLRLQG